MLPSQGTARRLCRLMIFATAPSCLPNGGALEPSRNCLTISEYLYKFVLI